jgi:vacuolar-type H+-ATPase subunit C/Vma6
MLNDTSYAYAKACGIIGKSFVGKRISSLAGLHNLNELDRLIFPGLYRELPGRELLADLERRIIQRTIQQIFSIVNVYRKPPEILIRLLKIYEYNGLKSCLHQIAAGKKELPALYNIGRFQTINFEAFPDLAVMLKNTEYETILSDELNQIKSGIDTLLTIIETKLDIDYYFKLTEALDHLHTKDQKIIQKMLSEEISLHNCILALRLRTYYNKSGTGISKYFMDIKLPDNQNTHSLSFDACSSLEMPLDSYVSWQKWRWKNFLNPEDSSEHWTADPRYFQNKASLYISRMSLRNFRLSPLTTSSIYCFIKIKQFEEDLLTSIAEGLALGMESPDIFRLLEVS